MLKRICAFLLIAAVFSSLAALAVGAYSLDASDAPVTNADAAVLYNLDTDEFIYEKNSDKKVFPASTVKLMTALVVYENVEDLDSEVVVPAEIIKRGIGNNISILAGEEFTVRQLLYAMLVYGANDAANALAYYVAGDISDFVSMMNVKASSIGAADTVYTNPTGIHDQNMLTTAYDTVLISREFCLIPTLVGIADTKIYVMDATNKSGSRRLYSKNLMITENSAYYYNKAKGVNSGATDQAGYCLVTMATDKGVPVLCVVMHSDKTKDGVINSYKDARALLKWTFSSYEYKTVLRSDLVSYEMPVKLSALSDYVLLYPDRDVELLLPTGIDPAKDIQKVFSLKSEYLEAPVKKDTIVGEILLVYDEEVIAKANLLTASDIDRTAVLYYIDRIDRLTGTTWFRASLASFAILTAIYLLISYRIAARRKKDGRFNTRSNVRKV